MDLSIIIVNWNVRDFLDKCLESILAHVTGLTYEVVVVDNASDDDSVAMVQSKYPGVRVIANERNLGFCRGNNQGLEIASGRFFVLLNPDTEVYADAFESMARFLDEHADVGIVGPMLLSPGDLTMPNGAVFPTVWREIYSSVGLHRFIMKQYELAVHGREDFTIPAEVDVVCGACLMGRREVFEQIGGLDEQLVMYFDEVDFCRRAKQKGWRVWYVPQARIFHHWMQSVKRDYIAATRRLYKSRYIYFKKHHGWLAAVVLRMLSQANVEVQCARIQAVRLRDRLLGRARPA